MTQCFRHVSRLPVPEIDGSTLVAEQPFPEPHTDGAIASTIGAVPAIVLGPGPGSSEDLSPGLGPEPPRIAVYGDPPSPPLVLPVTDHTLSEADLPRLIEELTERVHGLAREQGGRLPATVVRELIENLVHASFTGVVITILDRGNTIRVTDRGPGIPDKDAALRPGFTSADARAKRYIRGVGSGFSVIKQTLTDLGGVLEIEDNLGRGTVVTARISPLSDAPLAPADIPAYNLRERQLKTLLLTVELAPVGPTRIARELGVSTSTAYRDLVLLEDAGFLTSEATGHRSVTEAGLAYLDTVL
jgi:anti-sigma regulatory factor (Ser/Thr protein kinase)